MSCDIDLEPVETKRMPWYVEWFLEWLCLFACVGAIITFCKWIPQWEHRFISWYYDIPDAEDLAELIAKYGKGDRDVY